MFETLRNDIRCVRERDPAATSTAEVLFCYPGYRAVRTYRFAHRLHGMGMRFPARLISELCRFFTGVDIHPAAKIGQRLFIDHGMGVVIGETAVIGDDVTIYQGATLGGTGKQTGKRHPTVGRNVTISAGSAILGPLNVGNGAKIGAGAVVLSDVPAHTTVVGVPGHVVRVHPCGRDGCERADCPADTQSEQTCRRRADCALLDRTGEEGVDLDQVHLPDPVAQQLLILTKRIETLEKLAKG